MPRRLRIGWPTLPAWLAAISPGNVAEISNTKLSTAQYAHGSNQVGTANANTYAWGTFAHDPTTNKLYSLGGGHTDYNGNETYVIDMTQDAPTWSVFSLPTIPLPTTNSNDWYNDDKPASTHGYNNHECDPVRGRMMIYGIGSRFGGGAAGDGANGPTVFGLNLSNATWEARSTYTPIPGAEANTQGAAVAYDTSRNLFWYKQFNTNQIRSHNTATDTWTNYSDGEIHVQDFAMAYHPELDCLLALGGSGGSGGTQGAASTQITVWPLSSPTSSTGSLRCTNFPGGAQWGLKYHAGLGKLIAYHDSNTYYEITPTGTPTGADWLATAVSMGGVSAPNSTQIGSGMYGRFRILKFGSTYVAVWNGAISSVDTNMYAYRFN